MNYYPDRKEQNQIYLLMAVFMGLFLALGLWAMTM